MAYKPSSLIWYLTLGNVLHLQTVYITNVSCEEEPRHILIYHYITGDGSIFLLSSIPAEIMYDNCKRREYCSRLDLVATLIPSPQLPTYPAQDLQLSALFVSILINVVFDMLQSET